MRIWSVHPRYLDRQALVACWRETLLAQAVLAGRTKGYTRHPQLERFRGAPDPLGAVSAYLVALADEADARGYRFDRTRIDEPTLTVAPIDVTDGQLNLEWVHLRAKLEARSPDVARRWRTVETPDPHPSFRGVPGPVEPWERTRP
ncbi:pyrimidine dimer DNA glycosylase/endonuclease V [Tsukamurella sp. PLM1]|uniref:pyrimidine dimer DNA glycosylase/endonuclease V n=1 Tax=Tsukamurella sp. PLM1 TaxID=2929795 RepID=UPI002065C891|nr:pyrimidine dimer DNA glycosylase/endonuclease V [Tsukamurella sp. PLM1]BDH56064.1 pyrimidine dimer DNA glycosylase /DNA-(apurinic or apyrimidinic site) lyase [Tsukamurella sp. PLM1]